MIRVGSLFSGIGGLELGLCAALSEAGIAHHVAWQVEIDPFCRAVLAKYWPTTDRSVTDVRAAASLPRVDLLCGGFPCQDVSSAGLGAGLDGARSGLWFAYRDTIAALRPAVVVVENVASGKRRYLCRVRRDLRELGYRETVYQLGAHHVGAPHLRERVFVVAVSDAGRELLRQQPRGRCGSNGASAPEPGDAHADRGVGPVADADCRGRAQPPRSEREERRWAGDGGADVGDASASGRQGPEHESGAAQGGLPTCPGRQRGQAEPGVGREPHGLPGGLDLPTRWPAGRGAPQEAWEPPRTAIERQRDRRARLRALGNAVVPAQAREVGRMIIATLRASEAA